MSGFKFKSKLSTWVGQIAFNTCVNHLQRKKPWLQLDSEAFGEPETEVGVTEHLLEKHEISARLAQEIDQLPTLYKALIGLRRLVVARWSP